MPTETRAVEERRRLSDWPEPRIFILRRTEDISGTSGVGVVAQGVVFGDGSCALRWMTKWRSWAVYESLAELEAIHGHDGRTVIEFVALAGEPSAVLVLREALAMAAEYVYEWGTQPAKRRIERVLADTAQAAAKYEQQIRDKERERWREALEAPTCKDDGIGFCAIHHEVLFGNDECEDADRVRLERLRALLLEGAPNAE
jgi:hypothetical protein